ncbi:hypothetical protein PQX77_013246 [Marasmius sp. AFHP31]|nr:hypothetical protein PQX77_013246 [Marasmius sp. AFHP31]
MDEQTISKTASVEQPENPKSPPPASALISSTCPPSTNSPIERSTPLPTTNNIAHTLADNPASGTPTTSPLSPTNPLPEQTRSSTPTPTPTTTPNAPTNPDKVTASATSTTSPRLESSGSTTSQTEPATLRDETSIEDSGTLGKEDAASSLPFVHPESENGEDEDVDSEDDGKEKMKNKTPKRRGNPGTFSGDRLMFMESHMLEYLALGARSKAKKDFWMRFIPKYLEMFPLHEYPLPL